MARRTHLTDSQKWIILCADPSVRDQTLADAMSVPVSTVHNARWSLRRHGLSSRIAYGTCALCGLPLVRRAKWLKTIAYHPACRPAARKQVQRGIDTRRWETMAAADKAAMLANARRADIAQNAATRSTARHHGQRWTADDDRAIAHGVGHPARVLAVDLGRTMMAVRARRHVLRGRGLLGDDDHDDPLLKHGGNRSAGSSRSG